MPFVPIKSSSIIAGKGTFTIHDLKSTLNRLYID